MELIEGRNEGEKKDRMQMRVQVCCIRRIDIDWLRNRDQFSRLCPNILFSHIREAMLV